MKLTKNLVRLYKNLIVQSCYNTIQAVQQCYISCAVYVQVAYKENTKNTQLAQSSHLTPRQIGAGAKKEKRTQDGSNRDNKSTSIIN